MKKALLLLAVLFFVLKAVSYGQLNGHSIRFEIGGLKDTTVYLAYYNGESTYVRDTAQVSNNGSFGFEGKEPLPQGVYFLAMGRTRPTRLFEFVVGETQTFSLSIRLDQNRLKIRLRIDYSIEAAPH